VAVQRAQVAPCPTPHGAEPAPRSSVRLLLFAETYTRLLGEFYSQPREARYFSSPSGGSRDQEQAALGAPQHQHRPASNWIFPYDLQLAAPCG
jgi:hypothetical protein